MIDWKKRRENLEILRMSSDCSLYATPGFIDKIIDQEKKMLREFAQEIPPLVKIRCGTGQAITIAKDIDKLLSDIEK
jgi:hypothetical protein